MKKLQQKIVLLVIGLNAFSLIVFSQNLTNPTEKNSEAINITIKQNLQFGVFSQGAGGGTIIISPEGSRSVTGAILPLNFGLNYFQSVLEVEAPQGSIISIINGPDAVLTGSNGGTMTLQIGKSNPVSPFYLSLGPPAKTALNIGGTLIVGNTSVSPPGTYSGNFYISFILE
ncbi:MAG: DUF4402 domain-containing protein [Ferruginibacter sp.]